MNILNNFSMFIKEIFKSDFYPRKLNAVTVMVL